MSENLQCINEEDIKQSLIEVKEQLEQYNLELKYFSKNLTLCYIEVLSLAIETLSKQKIAKFKSNHFNPNMIEDVVENVFSFMTPNIRLHSELSYFQVELKAKFS